MLLEGKEGSDPVLALAVTARAGDQLPQAVLFEGAYKLGQAVVRVANLRVR